MALIVPPFYTPVFIFLTLFCKVFNLRRIPLKIYAKKRFSSFFFCNEPSSLTTTPKHLTLSTYVPNTDQIDEMMIFFLSKTLVFNEKPTLSIPYYCW